MVFGFVYNLYFIFCGAFRFFETLHEPLVTLWKPGTIGNMSLKARKSLCIFVRDNQIAPWGQQRNPLRCYFGRLSPAVWFRVVRRDSFFFLSLKIRYSWDFQEPSKIKSNSLLQVLSLPLVGVQMHVNSDFKKDKIERESLLGFLLHYWSRIHNKKDL